MSVMVKGTGGSGSVTQTKIWTNPSPQADYSGTTITLSQSMTDFDYIRVTARRWKADGSVDYETIMPVSLVVTCTGTNQGRFPLAYYGEGTMYARTFEYVSNTSIKFSNASKVGASGNLAGALVPAEVYGMKLPQ